MINPLSQKIRTFHNLDINDGNLCYIGTNDYGLSEVEKILKNHPNNEINTCHIGVSGYYNFDIAVFRKSERIIIFDHNPQQVKFMKQTLKIINISKNREEFLNNMISYLNIKQQEHSIVLNEKEFNRGKSKIETMSFMINISEDDSYNKIKFEDNVTIDAIDQIIYELERKSSWLSTDFSFNYIRKLSLKDHIAIFCEDIKSIHVFKRINNILLNNNIFVDTLYLTNVKGYLLDKDKLLYDETLKYLSNDKTMIIENTGTLNIRVNYIKI